MRKNIFLFHVSSQISKTERYPFWGSIPYMETKFPYMDQKVVARWWRQNRFQWDNFAHHTNRFLIHHGHSSLDDKPTMETMRSFCTLHKSVASYTPTHSLDDNPHKYSSPFACPGTGQAYAHNLRDAPLDIKGDIWNLGRDNFFFYFQLSIRQIIFFHLNKETNHFFFHFYC